MRFWSSFGAAGASRKLANTSAFHWENKGFRGSEQVENGGSSLAPSCGMRNLTVIQNPLKINGKPWFSQARVLKVKDIKRNQPVWNWGAASHGSKPLCCPPLENVVKPIGNQFSERSKNAFKNFMKTRVKMKKLSPKAQKGLQNIETALAREGLRVATMQSEKT